MTLPRPEVLPATDLAISLSKNPRRSPRAELRPPAANHEPPTFRRRITLEAQTLLTYGCHGAVLNWAMTFTLPHSLADLVAAHNAHDLPAFVDCFTDDAVVRDEGHTYFGRPAIGEWFENVTGKYKMSFAVTDLSYQDGEPVLHGTVSGDFPGSPIAMRYYLGLEDGKIVALRIAA